MMARRKGTSYGGLTSSTTLGRTDGDSSKSCPGSYARRPATWHGFRQFANDETHVEAARSQEVLYHTISSSPTLADDAQRL